MSTTSAAMNEPMGSAALPLETQAHYYRNLLLSVSWIECIIALTAFTCWTVTCWRYTQRFRMDYWVCLITLCLCMVTQAFLTYSVQWATNFGNISEFPKFSENQFTMALMHSLKWGWLAQFIAIITTVLSKFCIICFLDQVLGPNQRWRRVGLWSIGVTNTIFGTIAVVLLVTECTPIDRLWDITKPGYCQRVKIAEDWSYFAAVWSAASDFALAAFPIPIIWKLQMDLRTKLGLCVLMGFGAIAGTCAAIKASQLNILADTEGITYNGGPLIIATMTEQWVTLTVACIPPSIPVFRTIFYKATRQQHKRVIIASPEEARRAGMRHPTMFVPKSMAQFRSLAYAGGTIYDRNGFSQGSSMSRDTIINDQNGITLTTDVEVHYENYNGRALSSDDGSHAGDSDATRTDSADTRMPEQYHIDSHEMGAVHDEEKRIGFGKFSGAHM